MIHKNSIIFKRIKAREYEMTNPVNLQEGDIVRGFNPKTLKYEDVKILSILKINAPRVALKLSNADILCGVEPILPIKKILNCSKKILGYLDQIPSLHIL
jgi:hypothetical protein